MVLAKVMFFVIVRIIAGLKTTNVFFAKLKAVSTHISYSIYLGVSVLCTFNCMY